MDVGKGPKIGGETNWIVEVDNGEASIGTLDLKLEEDDA